MHTETNSFPLIHLDETDSTNRYLTQLCDRQQVAEYTTVCADYQTAGKGQRGNTWESERGKNLMFSLVLYPTFLQPQHQFILSQLTALAVRDTLTRWAGDIRIKWPNDIYWQEKKICGILIENELNAEGIARSIIGIGLNVNQTKFHSDAPNPVSLRQITGGEENPMEVLHDIQTYIRERYEGLRNDKDGAKASMIAGQYNQDLFRREGWHPYEDASGRFMARLLRVEPDGRYMLQDEAGKERGYLFKEVQYIL